jgi:hypothetical protein
MLTNKQRIWAILIPVIAGIMTASGIGLSNKAVVSAEPVSVKPASSVSMNWDSNSVTEIIEAYIKACGGSALSEIKAEKSIGTLRRGLSGKVPLEVVADAPGKWCYNQTFAWGDQACYGCDGKDAWIQDTKSIGEMSPRQRLDLQLCFDPHAPLKLCEFFAEMKVTGTEKVGEKEAVTVSAKSENGLATELAFAKETGLLIRAGDIRFGDYRDVGTVKRPYRIILGNNMEGTQRELVIEFTEIRHDGSPDDSLFTRPACVLSFKEAPLFTPRKQVDVSIGALEGCVGVYRHPKDPKVTFTVTRQTNHLMIKRTGWGQSIEIKPESELDYFIQFLGWEFHFIKNDTGKVMCLDIAAGQKLRAERIEQE